MQHLVHVRETVTGCRCEGPRTGEGRADGDGHRAVFALHRDVIRIEPPRTDVLGERLDDGRLGSDRIRRDDLHTCEARGLRDGLVPGKQFQGQG
jgi:hypothetical protein